jgi:hypothetical protein
MIGGEWKWAGGDQQNALFLVQGRFVLPLTPAHEICDFSRCPARSPIRTGAQCLGALLALI